MSNKEKTVVLGIAHWEREKETLEKLGFELIGYTGHVDGKPRFAELRRPTKYLTKSA